MRYLIELFCRLHFISTPNRPTLRTRSRSNIVMLWHRQSWVKYFFFVWERSAKHAERERERKRRERERIPRRVQRGKKVVVYVVCLASCSRRVLCNWERERFREDSYRIINETRQMVRVRASRTRGMARTRTRKKGKKPWENVESSSSTATTERRGEAKCSLEISNFVLNYLNFDQWEKSPRIMRWKLSFQ